jgi:hypothetical protein
VSKRGVKVNKKDKLLYYPGFGYNGYIKNMCSLLEEHYEVIPLKKDLGFWHHFKFLFQDHSKSVLVLNWIENIFLKGGGLLLWPTLARLLLRILKIKFGTVIYFRHNRSPHEANDRGRGERLIEAIAKGADLVFVHNWHANGVYVPHPLYKFVANPKMGTSTGSENAFVIFGTISPHKAIDKFLQANQDRLRVLILGRIASEEYKIALSYYESERVKIVDGYIDDFDLQNKILRSRGVIVCNESQPYVSGSFIYALSLGVRIFCRKDQYLEDLKSQRIATNLHLFENFEELIQAIESRSEAPVEPNSNKHFSNQVILKTFVDAVEKQRGS